MQKPMLNTSDPVAPKLQGDVHRNHERPFFFKSVLDYDRGGRHPGVVIQAGKAGCVPVLRVRHMNGPFATCSPSILGAVSYGLSANRIEDVDEGCISDLKGAAGQ
jgi:hypothetical protein